MQSLGVVMVQAGGSLRSMQAHRRYLDVGSQEQMLWIGKIGEFQRIFSFISKSPQADVIRNALFAQQIPETSDSVFRVLNKLGFGLVPDVLHDFFV